MKPLRAVAVAAVLALLGLLVWDVAHGKGGGVAQKVDQGKAVAAPKLDLPRLDTSGRLTLASLRGKVVVVNFWESYCIPCKEEARAFAAAARKWHGKGVVFVGVNAYDTKSAARGYMKRYGIPFANVHDGVGASFARWGVTAVPETFFVDRRGRAVPPHLIGKSTAAQIDDGIRRALAS
jgi:cytochrome c biogenesis protein CcmG, thiol:disulfide interchange protein DsbE